MAQPDAREPGRTSGTFCLSRSHEPFASPGGALHAPARAPQSSSALDQHLWEAQEQELWARLSPEWAVISSHLERSLELAESAPPPCTWLRGPLQGSFQQLPEAPWTEQGWGLRGQLRWLTHATQVF